MSRNELCGAFELSPEVLDRLEQGAERPTEDLIEQIIEHFSLDDNQASTLWVLAGYSDERNNDAPQAVLLPLSEAKAVYSDMVHVSVNNFGVVISFMQNVGAHNQPVVVSRLGMSKEHAKSVADVIYQTLNRAENTHKDTKQLQSGA